MKAEKYFNNSHYVTSDFIEIGDRSLGLNASKLWEFAEDYHNAVELEKCKNGHGSMTGDEYFWYNYCKIDGKPPKLGSWSKKAFEQYKEKGILMRKGRK